ncbi:Transcription elongation factor (TFIIS) family protein [Euphorbia peplus]|nr:Transcription elongation factor (TFIIS) family protein [Euphorbia peplus]
MTLEDFFTLTEMKDGLTAPSRVHELVAVMQKEKDSTVKNAGDATRQWAAVASTIAATENKDCLDLFIQLDGLSFIDKWLKDVKKFGNDAADGFVEESLTAILRALEKLQIDKERSVSSGIWITVSNLLDHGSSRVQDRARALFDSWKQGRVSDGVRNDGVVALHRACVAADCAAENLSLFNKIVNDDIIGEPTKDENLQSKSSNCPESEAVKEHSPGDREHLSPESPLLKEKVSMNAVEGTTLTKTRSFSLSNGTSTEPELDSTKKLSCFSVNSDMVASPSGKVEPGVYSSVAEENITESAVQNNVDTRQGDFGSNNMSSDTSKSKSPPEAGKDDGGDNSHLTAQTLNPTGKDDCSPDTLSDSPTGNRNLEKPEDIGTHFSNVLDIGAGDDDDNDNDDEDEDEEGHSSGPDYLRDDFNRTENTRSPDRNSRRMCDIDNDYGIDALEVARQVAQEVEREVIDYREPSCSSSSSDKSMASDTRRPDSPVLMNTKQEVLHEDNQSTQNQPPEPSSMEDARLVSSNNMEIEAENGAHELELSQVTEVAPEQDRKTEKTPCGFDLNDFDLNQEVCSDDMERPANPISTPISIVSASRPAVASGSPSAPLQFEGILGWKGSAATSAFRPASPRKTSDGDKILETGGTSHSSKGKGSFDFDLNVAEDGDEKMLDFLPVRHVPVSSSLQSGESSLEVGPKRSERPNLDLNRLSNEGEVPLRMVGQIFYPRNGHRSPSPASSSSSMQPSLRNFDLNDRPQFQNESSDQGFYHRNQNVSAFGISRPGDPVISILGTRVEVGNNRAEIGRKDFIPQHPTLANGKSLDHITDTNMGRMGGFLGIPTVPFGHSPVYGYNGLTPAPNMSLPSPIYGGSASVPYMMDTRMVPQMLSSASIPPYSQPSFIMNMTSAPPHLNGAGPSRPSFDLNSGFTHEAVNPGGLRQFFMPSQSRTMEEHLRANVQPSPSPGIGGIKRREPDSGWEPYSLPYKHPQPPWR